MVRLVNTFDVGIIACLVGHSSMELGCMGEFGSCWVKLLKVYLN